MTLTANTPQFEKTPLRTLRFVNQRLLCYASLAASLAAEETYTQAKKTYIHTKETFTYAKETYTHAKETNIHAFVLQASLQHTATYCNSNKPF